MARLVTWLQISVLEMKKERKKERKKSQGHDLQKKERNEGKRKKNEQRKKR